MGIVDRGPVVIGPESGVYMITFPSSAGGVPLPGGNADRPATRQVLDDGWLVRCAIRRCREHDHPPREQFLHCGDLASLHEAFRYLEALRPAEDSPADAEMDASRPGAVLAEAQAGLNQQVTGATPAAPSSSHSSPTAYRNLRGSKPTGCTSAVCPGLTAAVVEAAQTAGTV